MTLDEFPLIKEEYPFMKNETLKAINIEFRDNNFQ